MTIETRPGPYRTRRPLLHADNVVATSQPLAVQAGIDVLKSGGNAVDAAVATAITLTVVEPTNNGIGGDLFAIVWDGSRLQGLNSCGRSPRSLDYDYYQQMEAIPAKGWDSVTVPGAVRGWQMLSRRFGRLPFARLFDAAIHYAEKGFNVPPIMADAWHKAAADFADFPEFRRAFLINDQAPVSGQRFSCQDQATTLRRIAESGGSAFYDGDIAEQIAREAEVNGAALSFEDLAGHQSDWVDCLQVPWRSVKLHEIPPNGQGMFALLALAILEQCDLRDADIDETDFLHWQIEAMKLALSVGLDRICDADCLAEEPQSFISAIDFSALAASIDPNRAAFPITSMTPDQGTVYLATADQGGMMVSLIQSNYHGFGSGIVIPGTGIALHNRGLGFNLVHGHPNCIAGGKRPYHTIIPAFVSRDGEAEMSFGVMGAHMQAQGHVQVMLRVYDHGQDVQTALDAPRWYLTPQFDLVVESGFSESTLNELRRRGHRFGEVPSAGTFGGGQIIRKNPSGGFVAGSDFRKDGCAGGF